MNIHIHFSVRQLKEQQHHRKNCRRQNIAIRLGQRVLDQPVADKAPVDEVVDGMAVQLLDLWLGNESMKAQIAGVGVKPWVTLVLILFVASPRWRLRQSDSRERLLGRHGNQLVQDLLAKDLVYPLAITWDWRRDQHRIGRRVQLEVLIWVRQGIVRD